MNLNFEVRCYLGDQGKKRRRLVYKKRYDPPVKALFQALIACWTANNLSAYNPVTIKDITNTGRSITFYTTTRWKCNGAAGDNLGPVVGSGTTAVTIDDYKLDTQITHGTGSGQLSFGAVSFNAPQTSGQTRSFEVVRQFTNGSGGTVTVREIGLHMNNEPSSYFYLCLRDVLASAIDVENTKVLTVTYKIQATA